MEDEVKVSMLKSQAELMAGMVRGLTACYGPGQLDEKAKALREFSLGKSRDREFLHMGPLVSAKESNWLCAIVSGQPRVGQALYCSRYSLDAEFRYGETTLIVRDLEAKGSHSNGALHVITVKSVMAWEHALSVADSWSCEGGVLRWVDWRGQEPSTGMGIVKDGETYYVRSAEVHKKSEGCSNNQVDVVATTVALEEEIDSLLEKLGTSPLDDTQIAKLCVGGYMREAGDVATLTDAGESRKDKLAKRSGQPRDLAGKK
jgi:hypothetical protein